MRLTDRQRIDGALSELSRLIQGLSTIEPLLEAAAGKIEAAVRAGGKVMLFGNGGSASQAQHIAAEFVNRFLRDRRALPAIALTTDQSILTSIANDATFDAVFARQVEAIGKPGDVAIGLSTSGESRNVISAFEVSRLMGVFTIGLTGRSGGRLAGCSDLLLRVDAETTPRIQEMHLLIGHLIAEMVEARF
ncbi:MAG: SIS domain-containing protein [Acidobacteriota bacterium]